MHTLSMLCPVSTHNLFQIMTQNSSSASLCVVRLGIISLHFESKMHLQKIIMMLTNAGK
uniref:Uncharacterized protein n=1 Tax=Anguilla anguilla TaxID=7936 RepID=A0A0E9RK45_ANGAN